MILFCFLYLIAVAFSAVRSTSVFSGKEALEDAQKVTYTPEAEADRVIYMPGATYPPMSTQFSGFLDLNTSTGHHIHYMYFESEKDPSKDPIVFWTNGGPGSHYRRNKLIY
jgi:carboxypeptidase C (cathepsin A)